MDTNDPFTLHRNLGLPSRGEFDNLLGRAAEDTLHFKQHAKPVPCLFIDRLNDLQSSPENDADWRNWAEWLRDPSLYDFISAPEAGRCSIKKEFHDQLLERDFTELLPEGAIIAGGADIFHVTEWLKERFRVITHSYQANTKKFGKLSLPSMDDVRISVHKGLYTLCLDAASWFSQFLLSEMVRNVFVYKHQGKLYRWKRLGMGWTGSCGVAESALLRLMHRASKACNNSLGFVDNVKFDGSFEEVLEAGFQFMEDCTLVNVTINEISITDWKKNQEDGAEGRKKNYDLVRQLITQRTTFLGLVVDHQKKSVAIADKTLNKIRAVWDRRHDWSFHDFNAYISLLCFTMYATGTPLHPFADSLAAHRLVAHHGAKHTSKEDIAAFWRLPFHMLPDIVENLAAWTNFALNRGDVACPPSGQQNFTGTLFFDSCGEGYGIIKCEGDKIETFDGKWPQHVAHSTTSEPMGVQQLPEHVPFLPPGSSWLVVLDHTPLVIALNRGHGRSNMNNNTVRVLNKAYPESFFKSLHLPGFVMPADPISRGIALHPEGLRQQVLRKINQMVSDGRTGFSFYSKRPISSDAHFHRLDFANRLSRAEQTECLASWLGEPLEKILHRSSLDK